MQFRISHILVATLAFAMLAWGLSAPSDSIANAFKFGSWIAVVVLGVRAATHSRRERIVILSGLLTALSYGVLVAFDVVEFPTADLIKKIHPKYFEATITINNQQMPALNRNPTYSSFCTIGETAFAVVFGLLAAGLAAFWARPQGGAAEDR